MSLYKINQDGSAAVNLAGTVPPGSCYRLVSVSLNLSAAPTTSEDFTITLDAAAGARYDTLLYSLDLSAGATTDVFWQPDDEILLTGGDAIDVAWANTDLRTYGAQITFKAV